jgi:Family of unknown function (DUF5357)
VKDIKNFFEQIWNQLKPPKFWCWQTLVALSIFSWITSVIAETDYVKDALAAMGWLFLTLGVGWGLGDKKFKIPLLDITFYPGPWVSGALSCLFITEGFDLPRSVGFMLWPVISAVIASASRFVKPGPAYKQPDAADRQQIVLWILANSVISCWFGFHFLLQDWLRDFPSITADNYQRSAFVVKLGALQSDDDPANTIFQSRGEPILEAAAANMTTQLESRAWGDVERWLLNVNNEMQAIETEVKKGLAPAQENQFWSLKAQVPPTNSESEYTVLLQAVWQGPSSYPGGYYLEKPCQVTREITTVPIGSPTANTSSTQVSCDLSTSLFPNQPTSQPITN